MIEVTQADREAAASVAVLTEMRDLILAGKADHHAEPWAEHREQEVAKIVAWADKQPATMMRGQLIEAIESGEYRNDAG